MTVETDRKSPPSILTEPFSRRTFLKWLGSIPIAAAEPMILGSTACTIKEPAAEAKAIQPQTDQTNGAAGPTPGPDRSSTPHPTAAPTKKIFSAAELSPTTVSPIHTPEPITSPSVIPEAQQPSPTNNPTAAPTEAPATSTATAIAIEKPNPTASSTAPATATATEPSPIKTPTRIPPTATRAPEKTPIPPTATKDPQQPPTPVPPTATQKPPEPPAPTPKKEISSAAFPKEIGDLERDFIAIHNRGVRFGMISRDFAYLSQMAKTYEVKVEIFIYDSHTDNPYAQDIPDDQIDKGKAVVLRNPNGWLIPYGQGTSRRGENGVIQIHLSFNANFREIVSGQIFTGDQYAQFRKGEIERINSSTLANILRLKAPSSEWPKNFGPAPEDVLKIARPLPNLQLVISQ